MRLKVFLGASKIRSWHVKLLERLAARPGFHVEVEYSVSGVAGSAWPSSVELLFQLDAIIHGIARNGLASPLASSDLGAFKRGVDSFDLVLDLNGDAPDVNCRVWRLLFNGVPGEAALLSLLINKQSPRAEIREGQSIIIAGRLGTEYNNIVLAAFEDVLARTITLILGALDGAASKTLPQIPAGAREHDDPTPFSARSIAARAVKELTFQVASHLYRLCYHSPHWSVGWRVLTGPDTISVGGHPVSSGWRELPDDGGRFYADPFPIEFQNRLILFVEDFEHKIAKGRISAVAFSEHGPIGQPEPVLELPYHLSYPFVFVHDNEAWMVPESSSAGRIDLFRATKFPAGWVREKTLIDSVVASDPTLLFHNDRWWLFATVRDGGGAFSDALHIWFASDFRGPWSPHPKNPVLIDIASARPAGRIVSRNGVLFRPVQDCRRGYGHALGVARILSLDENSFEQSIETIVTPDRAWLGRRVHTLNSAAGFEFIDGSSRSGLAFGRS